MKIGLKLGVCFIAALSLASCSKFGAQPTPEDSGSSSTPEEAQEVPLGQTPTTLAWSKCIFELDKVEAIRGRNLDDLDKGRTVARNQFILDCLTAHDSAVTWQQTDEMFLYARDKANRKPSDVTLNSGNRTMPKLEDVQRILKADGEARQATGAAGAAQRSGER